MPDKQRNFPLKLHCCSQWPPSLPAPIPLSKLHYLFTSQYSSHTTAQLLLTIYDKGTMFPQNTRNWLASGAVSHPRWTSFLVREIFVVDKVALQLTFLQAIWFSSASCHSTDALYSSTISTCDSKPSWDNSTKWLSIIAPKINQITIPLYVARVYS